MRDADWKLTYALHLVLSEIEPKGEHLDLSFPMIQMRRERRRRSAKREWEGQPDQVEQGANARNCMLDQI